MASRDHNIAEMDVLGFRHFEKLDMLKVIYHED